MGRRRLDERRRLRVERYLLTLRRHGHQPQLEDSTMTTNTEALRRHGHQPQLEDSTMTTETEALSAGAKESIDG